MIEDEEFSFMEEEFMESKKPRRERVALAKKATLCGLCFGLSVGVAFSVVQCARNIAIKQQNQPEKITLQISAHPTTQPEETDKEKSSKAKDKKDTFGFAEMQDFYNQLEALENQCEKSIVGVSDYSSGKQKEQYNEQGQITGTIIAKTKSNIMVLTNYSKLQADEVVVRFFDGTDIEGSLYGADTRADLAIVAVPLDNLSAKIKEQMKVISFGDSGELSVGSMIFAFGSPNGALYSVEYGYVSGQETEKSIEDYQLDVYTTNMGYHSDGNGIICNAYGELLGMINRQSDTTENCTFYGIGKLKQLVESILNKEKLTYAGITAEEIPEKILANHSVRGGIYVTAVAENSPAYKAGVLVGDVISAVDGEKITSILNFYECIQKYQVGEKVTVTVLKNPFQNPIEKKRKIKLEAR